MQFFILAAKYKIYMYWWDRDNLYRAKFKFDQIIYIMVLHWLTPTIEN